MGGGSKKQTIGYRYYLDVHAILTHGPVDRMLRLQFDKRDAWVGDSAGGSISIFARGLFGGDKREGGVAGTIDFEPGGPTQVPNPYLQSVLGEIPAFRGVSGLVFRGDTEGRQVGLLYFAPFQGFYFGMNPYLKIWNVRLQRIHKTTDGAVQWYDAKAAIGTTKTRQAQATVAWTDRETDWFVIGASQETSGTYNNPTDQSWFKGYIDSVRITKGIARYAGPSFAVPGEEFPTGTGDPYWANTVTLLKFNGADGATVSTCEKGNPVTLNQGAVISTAQSKFGGSSCYFAGVDEWVKVQVGNSGQALGPVYTIEAWIYPTARVLNGHGATIVSAGKLDLGGYDSGLAVLGELLHQYQYDMVGVNVISLSGSLEPVPLNQWSHVAVCRTCSGLWYLYVNGKLACGFAREGDMNPAHIIRECLIDPDWGMGYLPADIDDATFMACADALHAEGFGLSLLWDRQMPVEDFIKEVVRHINATLYVSRTTGKFVLKLIRDDYDADTIPVLNEDVVERVEGFGYPAFGELVNSVTVNFWDEATNTTGSVTEQDTALIQQQGVVIGTTIQYPGVSNKELASRLAARDLRSLSSPLRSCTVFANSVADDFNIGDPFKLDWPDFSSVPIVMRVVGLALGDGKSRRVKITATEDQFALPASASVEPPDEVWVDPGTLPTPSPRRAVVEAPYYELVQREGQAAVDSILETAPEAGYVLASGERPGAAINAQVIVDDGSGYAEVGNCDFCPLAFLAADVDRMATTWTITTPKDLELVVVGSHAQIGNELVGVVSKTSTTLTVGRGVLDTIPEPHSAGDVIMFWDAFGEVLGTQYVSGETVNVKLLPVTSQGTLDAEGATADSVTFNSRAVRPYLPGNFKINTQYWPEAILGGLGLSWAHRDRKQQTAGELITFVDGSVGPEAGVTYRVRIVDAAGVVVKDVSGLTGETWNYSDEGTYTPDPYEASVVSMLHWDANATTDDKGVTWTPSNVNWTSSQNRFPPGSLQLTNSYDSKMVTGTPLITNNTTQFTIEAWVYVTGTSQYFGHAIFSHSCSGGGCEQVFGVEETGTLRYYRGPAHPGGTIDLRTAAGLVPKNQWVLCALTWDGSNFRLFVNGVLSATAASTYGWNNPASGSQYIGHVVVGGYEGYRSSLVGYIDDLRITNVCRYTASYPAQNAPFGATVSDLNPTLRIRLQAERGSPAVVSLREYDYTVNRAGYGYHYGRYFGGV